MTLRPAAASANTPLSALRSVADRGAQALKTDLLRRFLNAYWLRPENALWMTLRSLTLANASWARPSIDVSCGDGIFSFLHLGGVLDPAFDVFTSVADVRGSQGDMFDHVAEGYHPRVRTPPQEQIDVGLDCKASMLAKASGLGLYQRFVEHDNNLPLPFEDTGFQTVYCNAAYWVAGIDAFLAELRRITSRTGKVILQVKLDSMKRCTLARHEPVLGKKFLEIIGGERFDCWPTLADRQTWEARFAHARLTVESATPFVTRTHAHLWDIGLRPIAPLLIRMANGLMPQIRASIKADWVDLFCELLQPLCDPQLNLQPGRGEPTEIQYVLAARV